MSIFEAIFQEKRDDRVAIVYERGQVTYASLRAQTLRFSKLLRKLEINRGDRVVILLHDSPEFIASFISVCSSGAIAVPVNLALRADEQRAILSDCTARLAIMESDLRHTLLTDAGKTLQHLTDVVFVARQAESTPEVRLAQNDRKTIRTHWLNEIVKDEEGQIADFDTPALDQPAFILYTSGSTGEPKGAVHSQADIFTTNQTYCREVLGLHLDDRLFSSSRLPFAYGLGNSLSFPLLNGCTSVLCREKPTPEVIASVFRTHRPTIFFGVPVVYNLLLDYHRRVEPLDCSSLRLCISAGEALPARLGEDWEKTIGVEVLDGIGSTEMLHMFMSNHKHDVVYGSSGKVLEGYEARLLDEYGYPTPADAAGNLWVKGGSAASGYWQRPEATAQTFRDGWIRTGDLYRRDGEGYWFHMGRSDDCFKSSGQWVSPVEVEGALLQHPQIARAAVVEDFDQDGLPCASAFVICREVESDHVLLKQQLEELMKQALPRFKRPRKYTFVTELPYTATGKIQRFKLREQLRIIKS